MLSDKIIVVTGGTGLLGKAFCHFFEEVEGFVTT
jgi:NAD(P)-dependent dehydrogenase (short-subunit alcohol dehydrogenase family)